MEKETISIYTIAKEAEVSPATVSRVLTGSARVSEEKKKKVEELIQKYNFQPNALARGLSNIETKIIGVLVSDIRNPFYATMAVECERFANANGYMLMLCNSLGSNSKEFSHMEKLASQQVDAIIQIGGKVDEVVSDEAYVEAVNKIANRIPVLITGKLDGADCYQVNIDEGQSMEILLEYLVGKGHKDIALVGGRADVKSTMDKRFRYRQIMSKHGLQIRDDYIVPANTYDIEGGYEAMKGFLKKEIPLPSAIIAINDFTAVGIMKLIKEHGLKIPEDISVASFDNTYMSEGCEPSLTSVGYDYKAFGEKLIQTAITAIRKEDTPRIQLIKSSLFIRESCKKN